MKMQIPQSIFRQYDIRGKYPEEIDERGVWFIGRAFAHFLKDGLKKWGTLKIAVCRDARNSSPKLFRSFAKGLMEEGCNVVDIGVATTPLLYFAVWKGGYAGGAVITASHNPNPYNGIKLTRERAIPLGGETGIFWLRDHILAQSALEKKKQFKKGAMVSKSWDKRYESFLFKKAGISGTLFRRMSAVVDGGNGTAGPITVKVLAKAGIRVYPLHVEPDGNFPNHVPNPLIEENVRDIRQEVKKRKATLGVAVDGDGDRIVLIDEKGIPVRGDIAGALIAAIILRNVGKGEKNTILYDIRSSNAVPEGIRKAGGKPVASRIGHALIKESMRKHDALFASELSGHYYWGTPFFFEIPLVAVLIILKEMQERELSLSQLVKPYLSFAYSGEMNFTVDKKDAVLQVLKKRYAKRGRAITLDGLRVDFKDWWFLVRPSNTESLLRLVVEAHTKQILAKKIKELSRVIRSQA